MHLTWFKTWGNLLRIRFLSIFGWEYPIRNFLYGPSTLHLNILIRKKNIQSSFMSAGMIIICQTVKITPFCFPKKYLLYAMLAMYFRDKGDLKVHQILI